MTMAPTADRLYGAGPAVAPVAGGVASGKVAGGAAAVPSPDPGAAPAGASAQPGSVIDDPTFWLVATIAGVLVLASASA